MLNTRLSSKEQIVIPTAIRRLYELQAGQELHIIDTGKGILLQPADSFQRKNIKEATEILPYSGSPVSLEEFPARLTKAQAALQIPYFGMLQSDKHFYQHHE